MQKVIQVKNKNIGIGKPVICIPITLSKEEEIINEIKFLSDKEVEMIEWRIDFYASLESEDAIERLLQQVRPYLEKVIFLVTYRSKVQGGNGNLSKEAYNKLLLFLAKQDMIDFLDVECIGWEKANETVKKIKDFGRKVVASHHNFSMTPAKDVIEHHFKEMDASGADILKLAVMPKNEADVFRLLQVSKDVNQIYEDKVIVTMSMGKKGMMTRFMGEIYGSAITFGLYRKASAPGQIPYEQLNILLDSIHAIYSDTQ